MLKTQNKHYIIFTSSFVTSNPGVGAWTSLIYDANSQSTNSLKRYNNFLLETTPHYLDLESVVETLNAIHPKIKLTIIHDSSYLDNIMNKWIFQWESRGFTTTTGKAMANGEIIKQLSKHRKSREIKFVYTGNKSKPIYTLMAHEISKLHLHNEILKKPPAELQILNP